MLYLLTSSRESDRFLFGVFVFALTMMMACLFAIAADVSSTEERQGAMTTSGAVSRLQSSGPLVRRALDGRRNARRRLNVAYRIPIAAPVPPTSAGAGLPPGLEGPRPEPIGKETPASATPEALSPPTPEPPPAPSLEPPPPTPSPEPAPPAPAPEPPPPAPAPEPEPPPAPAPEPEPPAPQPSGEILFMATFDAGFGGWYVQSLDGRATTSTSDPYEGTSAARFEVRDGDVEPDTGAERSEVSGPTFDEGEDLYIRDAILVPAGSTFEGPWQIIQQLHEENWNGSPGLAVFLDSKPSLKLGAGDGSPTYWTSSTLENDRWYDLIYRVKLSQDPNVGFVEVWLDGVPQTLLNGQTRMYGQTIQASQTYLKAGIYRSKSSTGTSILEHDSIVVGTSYAAVSGA
jgi:hypothetical protein